jgi:hypothetical protein
MLNCAKKLRFMLMIIRLLLQEMRWLILFEDGLDKGTVKINFASRVVKYSK